MPLLRQLFNPSQVFHNILQPVQNVNAGVDRLGQRVANTGHQIGSTLGSLVDMLPWIPAGGAVLLVVNLTR